MNLKMTMQDSIKPPQSNNFFVQNDETMTSATTNDPLKKAESDVSDSHQNDLNSINAK
jgi:hypothetical protein